MTIAITLISTLLTFQFLDDYVLRTTSYGVYISQLIRYARVSNHLIDLNTCN